MTMRTTRYLAAAGLALLSGAALAHEGHAPSADTQKEATAPISPERAAAAAKAREYFTDALLLTQDGKQVRFYSDMLDGRMVLLNVIFTNCKDACPLITQRLVEVQKLMGAQFGSEVQFVSISSDPVRDTPAKLKAFAKKNQADVPGWTFLTGDPAAVTAILRKLGNLSDNVEEHTTALFALNFKTGAKFRIRPDAPPPAISERLKLMAAVQEITPAKSN